ncbi:hypothetical protein HPB50_029630 [Hyalomma asiaticum]|nr:hypothetical protein HPB50_029630 [Hyalomma asiaticum]
MARPRLTLGWTVVRVSEDLRVPYTFCATYRHGKTASAQDGPHKVRLHEVWRKPHCGVLCGMHGGRGCLLCRVQESRSAGRGASSRLPVLPFAHEEGGAPQGTH